MFSVLGSSCSDFVHTDTPIWLPNDYTHNCLGSGVRTAGTTANLYGVYAHTSSMSNFAPLFWPKENLLVLVTADFPSMNV